MTSVTVTETVLTGWIYYLFSSHDAFFAFLTENLALAEAVTFVTVGGWSFILVDDIFTHKMIFLG